MTGKGEDSGTIIVYRLDKQAPHEPRSSANKLSLVAGLDRTTVKTGGERTAASGLTIQGLNGNNMELKFKLAYKLSCIIEKTEVYLEVALAWLLVRTSPYLFLAVSKRDKISVCSHYINRKQAFLEEGNDIGYMLVGPTSTHIMFRSASYVIKLQNAPWQQFKCRWNFLLQLVILVDRGESIAS